MEDFLKLFENRVIHDLLLAVVVLLAAYILSRILRGIINRRMRKTSEDLKFDDPTKFYFLKNAINAILLVVALIIIFYSIPELKAVGLSLFAGASILAAIIGFASQQAFSNIVSGLFIILFKPFRVGDVVKFGTDNFGIVEDITLRHTVVLGLENRRLIVPNSIIGSETILNSSITDEKICNFIMMGISYDSDIDLAIKIMQEEAMKHPNYIDNRTEENREKGLPPVIVRLVSFGDSSVNLRAQVWSKDPILGFEMKCDLHKSIKERFDQEGIEIPYPYRTIVYKNRSSGE